MNRVSTFDSNRSGASAKEDASTMCRAAVPIAFARFVAQSPEKSRERTLTCAKLRGTSVRRRGHPPGGQVQCSS
jgi:hypothetical protein